MIAALGYGHTLAKKISPAGIPQRQISELKNGKRPIAKEMVKRLGKVRNPEYKAFL